ncbi:MAG: hypothetical protein LC721_12695, partial [Actinobacteria bacterium]|nr:hypothetical protein [Actinomycetota bacterium]
AGTARARRTHPLSGRAVIVTSIPVDTAPNSEELRAAVHRLVNALCRSPGTSTVVVCALRDPVPIWVLTMKTRIFAGQAC